MELIRKESLTEEIRHLTETALDETTEVRLSIYLPNYRSARGRIWKQSRKLLEQARKFMMMGLSEAEVNRRLALVEEKIFLEQASSEAQGVAYFASHDHIESLPLFIRPEPLVVVSSSFHVIPLLRSVASEPHYRLISISKDGGSIFRKEHEQVVTELTTAFEQAQAPVGRSFFRKESETEISTLWSNVNDFCKELAALQKKEPLPIALFGSDKLRHIVIENIRGFLTRPIFLQSSSERAQLELIEEADAAFRLRLADEAPCDVNALIERAVTEEKVEFDIRAIYREAMRGNIESLVITEHDHLWATIDKRSGEIELHDTQQNHLDDCLVDNTVEMVIQQGGSVLFAHSDEISGQLHILTEMHKSGVCAITKLQAHGKFQQKQAAENRTAAC